MLLEERVHPAERLPGSEVTLVWAPGRGVRRIDRPISLLVNQRELLLRRLPPQHEDDRAVPLVEPGDRGIRELLPLFGMRVGLILTNRQGRVEKQHALLCPLRQVSVRQVSCPTPSATIALPILLSDGGAFTSRGTEKDSPIAWPGW